MASACLAGTTRIFGISMKQTDIMFEMSNISSRTTGLPGNIVVWVRTEVQGHGHNKYRIKISKDKEWAGIFEVSNNASLLKNINNSLTPNEIAQIEMFVKTFKSHLINLIDGVVDTGEFNLAVLKDRGL